MCGINGIVNFDKDKPVHREVLTLMNNAIVHRGPDDEGIIIDANVGLGIRRLSIIDLAGGHQPISNEDKTIWVVCNGEIYNFKSLRAELIRKGHQFSTNSDTEVIVHQYEEDGENFLSKLNGMFGLALWDSKTRKLIVARDRVGIKPFYYYLDNNKFVFSSEPKAILQHPKINAEIDHQALWDYLTFRYVLPPRSMFKNIVKLYPGYYGVLQNGSFRTRQYWDIHAKSIDEESLAASLDTEECVRKFETQFLKSIKSHLISDVPLGVLLSGGLDSSAVLYAMRRLGIERIKTFSVGFDAGPEYNELNYARIVAKYFDTDHHEVTVGINDFIDCMEKYVYFSDEPLADLACIPLWYVSKLASESVKVVLSGEGSDELLAGYPGMENTLSKSNILKTYNKFPVSMRSAIERLANFSLIPEKIASKIKGLNIPLEDFGTYHPKNMTNYFSESEKENLLSVSPGKFTESYSMITDLYKTQKGKNPLDQQLYVYSKYWLADNLLTKADRMTMANSIELRVPFLDHEMIEFAFSLPDKLKIDLSFRYFGKPTRKAVLRQIVKGYIPRSIIERKKYGFPTPENRWLDTELNHYVKDLLFSESSLIRDMMKISELEDLMKKSDAKVEPARNKVWLLAILEIWHKTFIRGSGWHY
jgi:asparagine synthase (glutamine-hydrolysing)